MDEAINYDFSGPVTIFHDRRLPEQATPVGYAALIDALRLRVPVPRTLSAIGPRHKQYQQDGWHIYTPRHAPEADLDGHLTFALKYEGLDLGVLKALFRATGPAPDRSDGPRHADRELRAPGLVPLRMAARDKARSARRGQGKPTRSSSIRISNGRLPARRPRAIASKTICRERPPSVP